MKLIINNSSSQPVYEQIAGQIREAIMTGKAKAGYLLPSVRSLSKDLKISALTVKKAYDTLEQGGFITTVHGKGSFVTDVSQELCMEERRKEVEYDLEQVVLKGRRCGMTDEELQALFELIMEE